MPSAWIVDQIRLASDQELYFEAGVEVLAKKGLSGSADSLFSGTGKKNIRLIRSRGHLADAPAPDYDGKDYRHAEWRHVLKLHGCTGITVEGLTLAESGATGFISALGLAGPPARTW